MLNKICSGQKYGNLTVLYQDNNPPHPGKHYICRCDCGSILSVRQDKLKNNITTTCGNIKECRYAHEEHSRRRRKLNKYDLTGEYGIGYTSKGEEFYFDLEDYDKIKDYTWYLDSVGYVRANTYDFKNNKRSYIFMHNCVLNLPNDNSFIADHIHGINTISDNRKSNLRVVDVWQNNVNQNIRKDNLSGVKGVNFSNSKHLWIARLQRQGKRYYLGQFNNFDDAVKARRNAEEEYYGEYSYDVSQKM